MTAIGILKFKVWQLLVNDNSTVSSESDLETVLICRESYIILYDISLFVAVYSRQGQTESRRSCCTGALWREGRDHAHNCRAVKGQSWTTVSGRRSSLSNWSVCVRRRTVYSCRKWVTYCALRKVWYFTCVYLWFNVCSVNTQVRHCTCSLLDCSEFV